MNAYLNYLLEASIGLCLFLLVYQLLLRKETSFRLNRIFLLVAIVASLTFPLFKFTTPDSPVPSFNFSIDPSALKYDQNPTTEFVPEASSALLDTGQVLTVVYAIGLLFFLFVFILRLIEIFNVLRKSTPYIYRKHHIIELKGDHTPFSFFNYIFIGQASPLSDSEKQQVIEHESIHARLYHSVDIILLHAVGIIFWFNPVIRMYKKIFIQLHEFEADARAVKTCDVDEYCSLLARVALRSGDFKLASHFSNSLTLKRIELCEHLNTK